MLPNNEQISKSSIEYLWKIYQLNQDFIRLADTKAGAVLTVGAASVASWSAIADIKAIHDLHGHLFLWIALLALPWQALIPRIDPRKIRHQHAASGRHLETGGSSVIFFEEILSYQSTASYCEAFRNAWLNSDEFEMNLADQVRISSSIARTKLKSVKWAIRCLGPALFFVAASLIATLQH
jgi:hypothetical protein